MTGNELVTLKSIVHETHDWNRTGNRVHPAWYMMGLWHVHFNLSATDLDPSITVGSTDNYLLDFAPAITDSFRRAIGNKV